MTDDRSTLNVRRVRVRVTAGPDRGREAMLEAGTLLVGTHSDNDLVLRDPAVGKYHLELALVAAGVRVRDLGSDGGTQFAGQKLANGVLPSGSEMVIGRTTLQLVGADLQVPQLISDRATFGPMVGQTTAMRELFGIVERLAATDCPLLLEGEEGTGRTLLTKAIHVASRFAASPVTVVDFRLNAMDRPSLVQIAQRSDTFTLLLEHVGDAPTSALREILALYERREEGVLDARIIATALPGLRSSPTDNKLRRELMAHVCAVRLTLPPLRARLDDLVLLVRHFVHEIASVDVTFGDGELVHAMTRDYARNVKDLRAIVAHALDFDTGSRSQFPAAGPARARAALLMPLNARPKPPDPAVAKQRVLDAFTRDWFERLVHRTGDVGLAAREAGMARDEFEQELERLRLQSKRSATPPPKSTERKNSRAPKKSSLAPGTLSSPPSRLPPKSTKPR
ncbi:MAG: FHA domain-containing protein [Deltaproteobacteria bacterium]|nr:FHA domain-containing protein [Deltaproteobacteria bacterium]